MCLYPRIVKNPKYKSNKKNRGVIPPICDKRVLAVPIGCGECIECRKQKSREIQVRLLEDIKHNKHAIFVALTFSNENYEKMYRIGKRKTKYEGYDLDNWIAKTAVRRMLENFRKHTKKSVRHWLITELGHGETEHIHLHGIMYIEPKQYIKESNKDIRELQKELIEKRWRMGGVWVGEYVNEKTINYCSKYITKVDEQHKYYKPIILSSKGIGSKYIETYNGKQHKYIKDKTNELYTSRNGYKIALPIYWRNKVFDEDEREKLWLEKLDKEKRYVLKQEIDVSKNEKEYFDALKWARKLNKSLGYGDGSIDWERKRYEKELRLIKQKARLKEDIEGAYARVPTGGVFPDGKFKNLGLNLVNSDLTKEKDALEKLTEERNWDKWTGE